MTLRCSNCKSYGLEITDQSYSETSAFEAYKCNSCGATGTMTHDETTNDTTLSGSIESDVE